MNLEACIAVIGLWITSGIVGVCIAHSIFYHGPIRLVWFVLLALLGPIIFLPVVLAYIVLTKIDGK